MKVLFCWIQIFVCFGLFRFGCYLWKEEQGLSMKGLAIFAWDCIPCLTLIFIQSVLFERW